jgi:hypothetical protein
MSVSKETLKERISKERISKERISKERISKERISKERTYASLAIGKDCPISNGKSYVIKIPDDKLSEEEHNVWLKFSMKMYVVCKSMQKWFYF